MMITRATRVPGPVALIAALLSLSACSGFGDPLAAIGARIPPPDEFQVIASAPLVMPASATLPEPVPGMPSPLEPDPLRDAAAALLGPGATLLVSSGAPSAGEQVLLSSANAAAASGDIRVQLEDDKIQEAANTPYEPPSIFELFGGRKRDNLDEDELLDPIAESQRLQRQGQLSPVDPDPPVDNEERVEPVVPNYPTGRPDSPLKVDGTAPTF